LKVKQKRQVGGFLEVEPAIIGVKPRAFAPLLCVRKEYAPLVSCCFVREDDCSTFRFVDGGEIRARSCSRSALLRLAAARRAKFSFRVSCSLRRSCCIDSGVGLDEFGVGSERFYSAKISNAVACNLDSSNPQISRSPTS